MTQAQFKGQYACIRWRSRAEARRVKAMRAKDGFDGKRGFSPWLRMKLGLDD